MRARLICCGVTCACSTKQWPKTVAPELLRLLIAEAGHFPALLDEHYEHVMGPVVARLQNALMAAAHSGDIRDAPILDFPDVLLGPALSLNITMLLYGDRRPIDFEAHLEAAVDLMLNGLLKR